MTAREQWQAWQKRCDPSKLIFLDEASASTDLIRLYGRALGSAWCWDAAPAGHSKTLAFAGLRADHRITTPWCVDQVMKGEAFRIPAFSTGVDLEAG